MSATAKPRAVTRKRDRDQADSTAAPSVAPASKKARLEKPKPNAPKASKPQTNIRAAAKPSPRKANSKDRATAGTAQKKGGNETLAVAEKVAAGSKSGTTAKKAAKAPSTNTQVVKDIKAKKSAQAASSDSCARKKVSDEPQSGLQNKTTGKRKRKQIEIDPDVLDDEDQGGPGARAEAESQDNAETPGDEDSAVVAKSKRGGRKRAATPEDAETAMIDPASQTMGALIKRDRLGKKSRLEAAMQEIDWGVVKRRRMEEKANAMTALKEGRRVVQEDQTNTGDAIERADQAAQDAAEERAVPQMVQVNGKWIIPDKTTVATRQDPTTRLGADGAPLEEIEENDLTARVNSASWMHNSARDPTEALATMAGTGQWDMESTDLFYDGLRMFGTDFTMISKMFPGRTRRNVKNKFTREERQFPDRVTKALIGEHVTMDLEKYAQLTGKDEEYYKDPQDLRLELQKAEELQREEIEKEKADQREAQRKKQEAEKAKLEAKKKKRKEPANKNTKDWQNKALSITDGNGEEPTNAGAQSARGTIEEEEDMGSAHGEGYDEH